MTKRAFTLIELLVVVGILSILSTVILVSVLTLNRKSQDATRISDVLAIGKAIDQTALANRGLYPRNASSTSGSSFTTADRTMCAQEIAIDPALVTGGKIPQDPRPVISGTTTGCTSMLQGYTYHTRYGPAASTNDLAKSQGVTYVLEVGLESSTPSGTTALKAFGSASGRNTYLLVGPLCSTSSTCDIN